MKNIPFQKSFYIEALEADTVEKTVELHIWSEDGENTSELTGSGFFRVMRFVENFIQENGIKSFVVCASDEKRQRIFEKWAARKAAKTSTTFDYFEVVERTIYYCN